MAEIAVASLPAVIDEAGPLKIGDQLSYFSRHGCGLWHDSITVVSLSQALGGAVNLRRIAREARPLPVGG